MLCSVRHKQVTDFFHQNMSYLNMHAAAVKHVLSHLKVKLNLNLNVFGFSWLKLKISLSMLCKLFVLILGKRAVLCGH